MVLHNKVEDIEVLKCKEDIEVLTENIEVLKCKEDIELLIKDMEVFEM